MDTLQISCLADFFNSVPSNKILDMSKLKAFADHTLNVVEMMISVFVVRKHCRKRKFTRIMEIKMSSLIKDLLYATKKRFIQSSWLHVDRE